MIIMKFQLNYSFAKQEKIVYFLAIFSQYYDRGSDVDVSNASS